MGGKILYIEFTRFGHLVARFGADDIAYIPRIGESVIRDDHRFLVVNIIHDHKERTIKVIVE